MLNIVVLGYNRKRSLYEVFNGLKYFCQFAEDSGVKCAVTFSIDYGGSIAPDFIKQLQCIGVQFKLINREKRLGIRQHYHALFREFASSDYVLFVEDDVVLNRSAFSAYKGLVSYLKDDCVGLSLYSPMYDEVNRSEFIPDVNASKFFMKVPSSLGWCVKGSVIEDFLTSINHEENEFGKILKDWGDQSYKKDWFLWLIDTNKYFVYPTVSYCRVAQLDISENTNLHNLHFTKCTSYPYVDSTEIIMYDEFYQRIAENGNFEADLFGTKHKFSLLKGDNILTLKKSNRAINEYSTDEFLLTGKLIECTGGGLFSYDRNVLEKMVKKRVGVNYRHRPLLLRDIIKDLWAYLLKRVRVY